MLLCGIIPAYAGSTPAPSTCRHISRDHPRVCGEHSKDGMQSGCVWGSSPRMRGALRDLHGDGPVLGIIPAYAGSTLPLAARVRLSGDHPRVCGEHYGKTGFGAFLTGSSPRMRGALRAGVQLEQNRGIIPAYAGSTPPAIGSGSARRDHPRVCGEHLCCSAVPVAGWGSSPRMRGARRGREPHLLGFGIIPAYAGSTRKLVHGVDALEDHPRVCGEHGNTDIILRRSMGSSPRMRGAHNTPAESVLELGIIPAYAGSTLNNQQNHIPFRRKSFGFQGSPQN